MPTEFERRFLVDTMPDAEPLSETLIRQVYWRLGGGWSLRLRRLGNDDATHNVVTIKGPRIGLRRPEFEWPLVSPNDTSADVDEALEAALNLYKAGSEHAVVKRRRSFYLDGITWDIDEFLWDNSGLIIAEIEMQSQDELLQVSQPSWATLEVTTDSRYNNENLAYNPYNQWSF